ncbi:hypothetical protein HPB51_022421 [Rhipicephalus microplus]|uniref:Uncharacterized protein n=1 Tax=Rhipicephalus microplus TaxID=6941 RepID=A0A9J6DQU5_RHIMP|nr:hypothetical protein HPB51_022421 [Rhipicephalus microplus]
MLSHLMLKLSTFAVFLSTLSLVDDVRTLPSLESAEFRCTPLAPRTNKLTSFPEGLGDNLPALTYVSVLKNLITTLREQDFAPIRDKVAVVDLMFNPVHCDCNVSFILDYPTSWHYFTCAAPRDVKNTYASNLQHKQLKCQGTT